MTTPTRSLPVGRLPTPATRMAHVATVERLRPLLHRAAELDIDDHQGWTRLRAAACEATAELVAIAELPPHLAVTAADPPALVARTLVAAWRRAASRTQLRNHRL